MASESISQQASDEYMAYSVSSNGGDGFEIVDCYGVTWAWVRSEEVARIVVAAMNAMTNQPNWLLMKGESK